MSSPDDPSGVADVSLWEPAGDEYLGTKPKQWFRDGDGRLWLWKQSTLNAGASGEYRKGDDGAELIAGRIGMALGIPVATVRLARWGEKYGVVSRRVFDGEDEALAHGNELLAELGILGQHPHDRAGYDVPAVARALDGVRPPIGFERLATAFEWFVGYLILDALIANTDRHQDNWATVRSKAGRRLAPSFDHASSLGFMLSDDERIARLSTSDVGYSVAAYAARARTKFDGGASPLAAAAAGLSLVSEAARKHWDGVIGDAPRLAGVLDEIPKDRMSQAARQFAEALYFTNLDSLSHLVRRMNP